MFHTVDSYKPLTLLLGWAEHHAMFTVVYIIIYYSIYRKCCNVDVCMYVWAHVVHTQCHKVMPCVNYCMAAWYIYGIVNPHVHVSPKVCHVHL